MLGVEGAMSGKALVNRPNRVEGVSSGGSIACRGNGNCKGLEVGVCLADLRKSKETGTARTK